jgi:hypothetical protein
MEEIQIVPVNEFWRMRNGSIAHISGRALGYALGTVDESGQQFTWRNGKTDAGPGYDLLTQFLPEEK